MSIASAAVPSTWSGISPDSMRGRTLKCFPDPVFEASCAIDVVLDRMCFPLAVRCANAAGLPPAAWPSPTGPSEDVLRLPLAFFLAIFPWIVRMCSSFSLNARARALWPFTSDCGPCEESPSKSYSALCVAGGGGEMNPLGVGRVRCVVSGIGWINPVGT